MKTREDAKKLLYEWISSESLRRHCLGVAACMEAYAKKFDENSDKWWITGLLHDFDWEKFPDIDKHPIEGCKKLREEGYDEDIIEAILGHNPKTGIPRRSLMAKTLFAVDELSGLVFALAKVRPGNFEGMSAKSVKKAMKKKDFAAAINRGDINLGIEEMNVDRDEHFMLVVKALNSIKVELGLGNS